MVSKAEAQKAMEDAKRASDAFFRRNDAETKKLLARFERATVVDPELGYDFIDSLHDSAQPSERAGAKPQGKPAQKKDETGQAAGPSQQVDEEASTVDHSPGTPQRRPPQNPSRGPGPRPPNPLIGSLTPPKSCPPPRISRRGASPPEDPSIESLPPKPQSFLSVASKGLRPPPAVAGAHIRDCNPQHPADLTAAEAERRSRSPAGGPGKGGKAPALQEQKQGHPRGSALPASLPFGLRGPAHTTAGASHPEPRAPPDRHTDVDDPANACSFPPLCSNTTFCPSFPVTGLQRPEGRPPTSMPGSTSEDFTAGAGMRVARPSGQSPVRNGGPSGRGDKRGRGTGPARGSGRGLPERPRER